MSSKDSLSEGSVVRLKSGGPAMTIMSKAWGVGYVCQWFEGTELKYGTFAADGLEVVDSPAGGSKE